VRRELRIRYCATGGLRVSRLYRSLRPGAACTYRSAVISILLTLLLIVHTPFIDIVASIFLFSNDPKLLYLLFLFFLFFSGKGPN